MSNISCVEPAITVDRLSGCFWVVYVTCRENQPHMVFRVWETGVETMTSAKILLYEGYKFLYYSTIALFYHIRAKERAKYATLLHCRTGQKYGLKRTDKMAAQNEPNFALFKSSDLDSLMDELFTEMTETEQTETSE